MKRLLKVNVMLPILLGSVIGLVLFFLGNAEDAPGLSFIGLAAAFLLIMRGLYHAKVIKTGYHMPMVFLVFGVIGILFPIILFLDGEIEWLSITTLIGNVMGIALLVAALIRIKKVRTKPTQQENNR